MALVISNLQKRFGKRIVLDRLTLNLESGHVYVIVGANGSGKTTLMNIINDLVPADDGVLSLDGYPLGDLKFKKAIYYLPSDFYLPEYLTGVEYVNFILSRYPNAVRGYVQWLFALFELDSVQNQTIESYSYGMKKKVQLIAAISANTNYIFADEVFGGLDFETVILLQEIFAIMSRDKCIVVVSHDSNTLLRFPRNILHMEHGHIERFDGTPEELVAKIKEESGISRKVDDVEKHFIPHPVLS